MCNECGVCDAWISLVSVGVSAQGCLRSCEWLSRLPLPSTQSIINQLVYVDTPTVKITCIKNVSHGTFGYIDLALYQTPTTSMEVYVKRPILSGKSLLQEACIQKMVHDHMVKIGFPTGAPRVLHIFRLRDDSICFAMEPIQRAQILDTYLKTVSTAQMSSLLVECLLQLSAMIWYLNNNVGINHRDLKPSNFLLVEHEPRRKVLMIENEIIEISSRYSLTLIDFGFSCLGSTKTRISDMSLSTVYPKKDPCPKDGRDLYLFLGLLYIDYYARLPPTMRSLFEMWLEEPGSKLCHFMRKDGENAKQWLYFMAGNEKILVFRSYPARILADLQSFITQ
jgi:serine/threonine protein kinase